MTDVNTGGIGLCARNGFYGFGFKSLGHLEHQEMTHIPPSQEQNKPKSIFSCNFNFNYSFRDDLNLICPGSSTRWDLEKKVDPVSLSVYIRNRNELYTMVVESALARLYF